MASAPAAAISEGNPVLPAIPVEGPSPVRTIKPETLQALGQEFSKLFDQYASDRRMTELEWLKALRQYLGIYDPDVERQLPANASRAYPRITRVKCVSLLSRIMNLMFPGNERNWELKASPSADMNPEDVMRALQDLIAKRKAMGLETPPDEEILDAAVQELAEKRAGALSRLIDDQLQELGGDQTHDVIRLTRAVVQSGIIYGLGVMRGPFVREEPRTVWQFTADGGAEPQQVTSYKPQFDFTSVWDFYPDMTARRPPGEGYFIRMVMDKSGMRELADREDFLGDQVKKVIKEQPKGNYKPREYETDLRGMGSRANVNEQSREPGGKFEVIAWYGPIPASKLIECGADIPEENRADDIEAELWMVGNRVIKADMNPWRRLGVKVRTVHTFVFDEDDTSPIGKGLPMIMRDSQMSVCAAARMALDNASITCGPNLEVNTDLVRMDQDLTSITPFKIWYREGVDQSANYPAIRELNINGHLGELQALMATFMQFADLETFIGAHTGGDMQAGPSEPMRTAAGASMLRADAALPFKDIIRNFDGFTQSMLLSLVQFNRKYNPGTAAEGDYNIIARGATSLIAKEVRGMQIDVLAQSMTDEEKDHVDMRKFARARLAVRDMEDMLVAESQAQINRDQRQQAQQQDMELQRSLVQAQVREALAGAFKDIAQARKNDANAEVMRATAALDIMAKALEGGQDGPANQP